MTATFKPGDKVRVTIDASVTAVSATHMALVIRDATDHVTGDVEYVAEAVIPHLAEGITVVPAPISVIGEHSSGNDPWANALDMVTSAAGVDELRADRDRARDAAVALEQENARLREQTEDRVHRVFADADVEGVDLNAMTVAELTALVMAAINGGEQR